MSGPCHYCTKPGDRVGGQEDGLNEDLFVCRLCWKLLQNPATALPLIRGDLNLSLRSSPEKGLVSRIDRFVEELSTWKRRD